MDYTSTRRVVQRHILFLLALFLLTGIACALDDEYITDAQTSCHQTHDSYSCFKFRTLRYVSSMASGNSWPLNRHDMGNGTARVGSDMKIFKFVHIRDAMEGQESTKLFEGTRQMKNDSEFEKFVKFGKRQVETFLKSHGITFGLPEGAATIPYDNDISELKDVARSADFPKEARGKKKKLAILLPLLSLLALFKVKLLLVPILLTVLFIKKMLVLAALFLPSILSTLKVCKMQHPQHGQWGGASGEVAADYASTYGGGYAGYGVANAAYNKDWGASRAYGAHKQSYEKQNNAYKTINDIQNFEAHNAHMAYAASANAQI